MIHYITTNGVGQAWVGNELQRLEHEGIPFVLHAMREPHQRYFTDEWMERMSASTRKIYPIRPLAMAASLVLAPFLFGGRFFAALGNALLGKRESARKRAVAFVHFLVACHWARGLRNEKVSLIHSQWIHSSGTIGFYGAWLLGVPFSFTGHAADLFRDRVALEDKVRRAAFIGCISSFHRELFRQLGAREEQLRTAHCGIDLALFPPPARPRPAGGRKRILSSGRLVEKKGFAHLIEACRLLVDRGEDIECEIAGTGPLEAELRQQIERLRLTDRVFLPCVEYKLKDVASFLHGGDIYCLPCVWARDRDVDGVPQTLMEAMACGLPVVSTRLVGIPDLVVHEETGLLADSGDSRQVADAIARLLHDPGLARQLAARGRQRVIEQFNLETSLEELFKEFARHLDGQMEASTASTSQ